MLPPAGRREPCRLIRVAGAMGERRPGRASLLHRLVFRGNKVIRIENFRERGEALEAAGLSE